MLRVCSDIGANAAFAAENKFDQFPALKRLERFARILRRGADRQLPTKESVIKLFEFESRFTGYSGAPEANDIEAANMIIPPSNCEGW